MYLQIRIFLKSFGILASEQMEKQGKDRAEICEALKEKFGEKNPDVRVMG